MALRRETDGKGHLDHGEIRVSQEFLGPFDAACQDVLMRCLSDSSFEGTRQV
jgi:hypothetical protein